MTITLTTHVKDLKGVGPSRAAALGRLGIKTVDDLLHHYPSGYYFAPPRTDTLPPDGRPATVSGLVHSIHTWGWNFSVHLDTGVEITWFNGTYLKTAIFKGSCLMVSGVVRNGRFTNPEWRIYKEWDQAHESDLNTITYPVTNGITSKDIARLVRQCLDAKRVLTLLREPMLYVIHQPKDEAGAAAGRRHFKYDELFYFQLGLAVRQAQREREKPNVRCIAPLRIITDYFPFVFTADQRRVVGEIMTDLYSNRAMNRLLQGDVGCGKTAVAAYAAIVMAFNGGQTAILCPTEILARQHYETIKGYFERAGVKHTLVVSGSPRTIRAWGKVDIIIGTTALLQGCVRFRNLGLVIVDEQHKFGVEQRAALRRHGNPHCLVMTATPIPRTIAMTVFGDLDVSTIRSMPPGRKPVITQWGRHLTSDLRSRLGVELAAGHQVYVVCPRIEALDDEMRAVEEVYHEYIDLFPGVPIGWLHGKMTTTEKQGWAKWWADASYRGGRILVSTTVVEVGVDNPNATVMVIEGAERFGLAQLHQLRGRVGRGKDQSYCFLLSDTDSAETRARLRAMENTNDGFEIAEADLRQRGPGDLLSTKQHGLPELRIADLVEDYDLMLEARKEARELVAKGPLPADIRVELEKRFREKLLLGDTA